MIFIFKTSVKTKTQIKKLKPHIDFTLAKAKWNFDLKDRDCFERNSFAKNS